MRLFIIFLIILMVAILGFSLKFGLDFDIARNVFFYLGACTAGLFFLYKTLIDDVIPRFYFYAFGGFILSFGFYPILDFYSVFHDGYSFMQQIGFEQKNNPIFAEKRWFGKIYGKALFTFFCTFIGVLIYYFFDNK